MAFNYGFWTADLEGTHERMNYCLLGWGLKSEFPAAVAGNAGMTAYATDERLLYYSDGSTWTGLTAHASDIGARVYHSVSQVLPYGSYVTLAFNTEIYDTGGLHDPVTNNTDFKCVVAGKYAVGAKVRFSYTASATPNDWPRGVFIFKGGLALAGNYNLTGKAGYPNVSVMTVCDLAVNDIVTCRVVSRDPTDDTAHADDIYTPGFWIQKVG